MKKFFFVAFVVIALSAILTACGQAANNSTTLTVDMSEFAFTPKTVTVQAGSQVTLELTNSGATQHDFAILKKGTVIQSPFDQNKQANDIYFHAVLDAGKSGSFIFTAPTEPGEYQIVCGLPGHIEAGMTGSLTILAP